jgi:pimeloyl-ACP methyl ester carboxylesterase
VIAHLRGGGEFGKDWHDAGRREGKRLSHDDFAAVAADLVARGVTRPERIAAEGGSNGGLLIANMLTRYPERFGALLCAVPVIDMRRSKKLLVGNIGIDEYGDPDTPEDWKFLSEISAYHVASPGKPIRRSCLRQAARMTAFIPLMRERWRPSYRPWAMKPILVSPLRVATAPAKTTANGPPFRRLLALSCAAPSVGT